MRTDRLVIASLAFVLTAASIIVAIIGFNGSFSTRGGRIGDPAASGRGTWLLNPYCRNAPAPGFDRPPNVPRTGSFTDAPFGYAVTIPPGLTAYAGPIRPPQGFGLLLSPDPRVYLRVDASYDVFYDITAAAAHRHDALEVRMHDKLLADSSAVDALGGQAAGRFRMQFQCPGDSQIYLRDDLIVVRSREVYRLELQTVPSRYEHDVQLLNAVQHSWRWIPPPSRITGSSPSSD